MSGIAKVAVIRSDDTERYPVGTPGPCWLNCPCGANPPTDWENDVHCPCGVIYSANGWVRPFVLQIDRGDGLERFSLEEFIADNPYDAAEVRRLTVGGVIDFGGGAAHHSRVWRVS